MEEMTIPFRLQVTAGVGTPSASHVTFVSWFIQELICDR